MVRLFAAASAAAIFIFAAPASQAQVSADQPASGCAVAPQGQDAPAATNSLGEKLDRCGGVLVPPKVGDHEIVKPAPDEGTIRVIPPSALPEQQTQNEGPQGDVTVPVEAN